MNRIKSNKRFEVFEIKYTDEEKECIKNFKITKFHEYLHGGTSKMNKLTEFLENISNISNKKQISIMKNIIKKILIILIDIYKTNFFSIVIRSTNENIVKMPTWHIDDDSLNFIYKIRFVTTLVGPSTIFLENDKDCKLYYKLRNKETNELNNKKNTIDVITIFNKYISIYNKTFIKSKIIQAPNNQGVIFNIGVNHKQLAAVHREPTYNEPRLFISIIPHTKNEIKILKLL